jgi:hypothetical protein
VRRRGGAGESSGYPHSGVCRFKNKQRSSKNEVKNVDNFSIQAFAGVQNTTEKKQFQKFRKKVFIISESQRLHAWLLWVFGNHVIKKNELKNADEKTRISFVFLIVVLVLRESFLREGFTECV